MHFDDSAPKRPLTCDVFPRAGAPAPVTLQLTSQAFACTALTQGVSLLVQPPPTLLHSWDACWSCGGSGREAETDGGGDAAGESWNAGEWRVDWADLLGAEVVKAQATGEHILVVHFVDRHPRYGRDQHSWHVGAERFLAPGEGPCQSTCDAIRSTLRGPAFSNRPRRLLVRSCSQSRLGDSVLVLHSM